MATTNKDDMGPDDEKRVVAHLEDITLDKAAMEWNILREDAMRAEADEHSMSVLEALKTYRSAVMWSCAISLCIIMDGYDTGLLSNMAGLPTFRQKYGYAIGGGKYQLTPAWQTAITESSVVGNVLGIFISSWFQDRFGYIRTIQIFLIMLTGLIFIVFYAPTVEILFVGLLLCGLPWGAFSSSAVSYASEVTPIRLRGYLTTYVNLCWIFGQFIAAGVQVGVANRTDQWQYRIPFAIQWIWPIPLFILATLAPESPWYLVRKGRLEDAKKSVTRLARKGDNSDPTQIVSMMVRTNTVEEENHPGTSYFDCFRGTDRRRTMIACFAWAAQVTGGSSFANSPTYFFQQAGFNTSQSFNLTLGSKGLAVAGTLLSWVVMTYMGRRPVFVIGNAVLSFFLFLIGFMTLSRSQDALWAQAAFVMLWIFVFDFTTGPLAYAIVGEASSTRLRSKTVGLSRISYNLVRIVCGLLNTYMLSPVGWNWRGYSGFFWGGLAFFTFVWSYCCLPEFKDRSFRELDILFERGVPSRKFKTTVIAVEDEH